MGDTMTTPELPELIALSPCPFCGASDPKVINLPNYFPPMHRIVCSDVICMAMVEGRTPRRAVLMWERRAPTTASAAICPTCGGTGGERWQEADGSENGQMCAECNGFAYTHTTSPALASVGRASSAEINALPDKIRSYIANLETEADPAGTIRENILVREENQMLRAYIARSDVSDLIAQYKGCANSAYLRGSVAIRIADTLSAMTPPAIQAAEVGESK